MKRTAAHYTLMADREILATWRLLPFQVPTFGALLVVDGKLFRAIGIENSIIRLTPAD